MIRIFDDAFNGANELTLRFVMIADALGAFIGVDDIEVFAL